MRSAFLGSFGTTAADGAIGFVRAPPENVDPARVWCGSSGSFCAMCDDGAVGFVRALPETLDPACVWRGSSGSFCTTAIDGAVGFVRARSRAVAPADARCGFPGSFRRSTDGAVVGFVRAGRLERGHASRVRATARVRSCAAWCIVGRKRDMAGSGPVAGCGSTPCSIGVYRIILLQSSHQSGQSARGGPAARKLGSPAWVAAAATPSGSAAIAASRTLAAWSGAERPCSQLRKLPSASR